VISQISKPIVLLAGISLACAVLPAQNQRPVAILNANILTMEGKPIQLGMVLFRNGKIVDVGKKVKVPAGAKIIDAKGGTVMPGLVSAYSRAGLSGSSSRVSRIPFRYRRWRPGRSSRSSSSGGSNRAAKKVVTGLYARQKIFRELLEQGVTTLALTPSGTGFPGQGAILDPSGKTLDELTLDDAAFLMVNPANNTKTKKLLKDTFEKAKKVLEERKKPAPKPAPAKPKTPAKKPAATKKPTSKPTPKPGEKKKEEKKEQEKKPPQGKTTTKKTVAKKPAPKKKKDPNLEVLADLLDKKQRAFITLNSATDLVHYLDAVGDTRFKTTVLATQANASSGLLDEAVDNLKKLKAPVLMEASLSTKPYTDHLVNPAANLHRAGIQVGFVLGDSKNDLRGFFPKLIIVVRHGLDRDVALKAVTLVPATMLGVQDRVGSIKKDKDADLLLFSGDPLDPTSQLVTVWHKGVEVKKESEEQ
jgi:imidazolonepropionase-like amidohydrolase